MHHSFIPETHIPENDSQNSGIGHRRGRDLAHFLKLGPLAIPIRVLSVAVLDLLYYYIGCIQWDIISGLHETDCKGKQSFQRENADGIELAVSVYKTDI